jgi:hypothetical protein
MKPVLQQISLGAWDCRYRALKRNGLREPVYGGPLRRHVTADNLRLPELRYDNSVAALRLWNFLLTEEERLHRARKRGKKIVGTMKDLGTVPVMAYSLPNVVAFYPDGAWWLPCLMASAEDCLHIADGLGIGESFCPVRAMLGAFVNGAHFPRPDLLTCSVGATCDDFSSIAQRLNGLGYSICWWEIPYRRCPDRKEEGIVLPGGFVAARSQIRFVKSELNRIRRRIEAVAGRRLDDARLSKGIRAANQVRRLLAALRRQTFMARRCPLPALELLIAEMLAIHFCSDREEAMAVLDGLLREVNRRVAKGEGFFKPNAARIFWVNPVADLRAMNLLEEAGGRICGTDYMFSHALDLIPEDLPPMEALARMALADPMVGTAKDRASRIVADTQKFGAEAVVISRIPGASHCATEGSVVQEMVHARLNLPLVEIEVPPVSDALLPSLRTRLEALVETVVRRRNL